MAKARQRDLSKFSLLVDWVKNGSNEVGSEWRCLLGLSFQIIGEMYFLTALSLKAKVSKVELLNLDAQPIWDSLSSGLSYCFILVYCMHHVGCGDQPTLWCLSIF